MIWGGNMRKSFLIVRSNIRKAKGQTAAIVVLIMLAALMLNLWLMLATDYKANFDRYHDKLNAEHVTLAATASSEEFKSDLSQMLDDDSDTAEYSLDGCMFAIGTLPYNGGEVSVNLVILEKQAAFNRTVGKLEIIEDSDLTSGIYLPLIYKTDDIDIGKPIEISMGTNTFTYTVCGFFNSIMMGSSNCTINEIILTQDKYDELENSGYALNSTLCSVRLNDKQESPSYETSLKNKVSDIYPDIKMLSNSYESVLQSRYISQSVCSQIISAMAFFILLIALVVIISNIVNYIQVSMINLGALKAEGYTSGQLICSLLLQFLSLSLIASLVGTGASYLIFPSLNEMMILQTGIPYETHFLPLPFALTFIILGGAVALSVWFAARKIKKIEPITALRSGIQTHNFKRNHIPLETTKAPLTLALALKNTVSGVKHNITVCITMLVLSLVVVFSGLMTENIISDATSFINLIVGETADSCIDVQTEVENDFLNDMKKDSRVNKIYLYTSQNVSHTDGTDLYATICDDFSMVNNQSVVFEGRFPKYDNEIAIAAKYANENGFKVGDEIEITANGKQEKYLICGFTQTSNYLGRDCLLTRNGYERLGKLTNTSYYLNLTDETDIDKFNQEVKDKFGKDVNTTVNIRTTIGAFVRVYVSLMTIIVIAILVISAVIIVFVLYLLVRTMLNNRLREYGIMKALGYTTPQLILQTALSFMPTTIISVIVGLIVSAVIINPLVALFLSGIGIVKCTFTVSTAFIAVSGIVLILFAFVTVCLLSLKIRKIAPKSLLSGE